MKSMINLLSESRIVGFALSEDNKSVEIYERCKDFFGKDLDKNEFLQLILELQAIADKMEV